MNSSSIQKAILAIGAVMMFTMCAPGIKTYKVKGNTGSDIQAMIDKASARGGGKVIVPAGKYETGSIQLKSNVELHLEKDALLLGADKSEAYDSFPEEKCSIRPENSSKAFIYAYDSRNIALTGDGVIDGQGLQFFDTLNYINSYTFAKPPIERPIMVQFANCDGIRLEGVTYKDSPCWTMFIRLCENIDIDGIRIYADQRIPNNDGIDIDGCKHVRVSNSDIKTADDCLILRAIRENAGQHVVCEDVIVTDCVLDTKNQTVRLGCPSDDLIKDALFKNIVATGMNGIFADYPTRYLNTDDEGFMDISNIVFENYSGSFYGSAVQIVSQPGVKIRRADGFVFRNFDVKSARSLNFIGNQGCEIGSVLLENFKAEVSDPGAAYVAKGCNGLVFNGVTLNGEIFPDGPVSSEPGSNEALVRGNNESWEQRSKKK